jgi:ATP-dependent DNA ligase
VTTRDIRGPSHKEPLPCERCIARKDSGELRLESRTGKDLTGTYPEVLAAAASQQPRNLLLDGEVVAYEGEQTSFSRLQQRLGVSTPSAELVADYPGRLLRLRPDRARR